MYEGEKREADVWGKEIDPLFRHDRLILVDTLEELEKEFSKVALELFKVKSTNEDEENMRYISHLLIPFIYFMDIKCSQPPAILSVIDPSNFYPAYLCTRLCFLYSISVGYMLYYFEDGIKLK